MFDYLIAVLGGTNAAAEDHLDRNRLQEGKLPDHLPDPADPNAPECVVDSNDTTWIADGPGFYLINDLLDLHPGDVVAWRGIPAAEDPSHHDDDGKSPLSEPGEGIGYQAIYDRDTGELSPSSTADFVGPHYSLIDHFSRDVLPDQTIGTDYHSYELSSGENLQNVSRDAPPANVWPCENGEYVGDDAFKGIQPWEQAQEPPAPADAATQGQERSNAVLPPDHVAGETNGRHPMPDHADWGCPASDGSFDSGGCDSAGGGADSCDEAC